MKATRENKYKECPPEETVERIKKILQELEIELEENWIDTGMDGFFALRVNVAGSTLGSNGKGATRAFAQASAYAEFMERLQNDYFHRGDYDEDTWHYKGFYHDPREKLMSAEELDEEGNAFANMLLKAAMDEIHKIDAGPMSRSDLLELWHIPVFKACNEQFLTVPCYSVKQKKVVHIPYKLGMKLYHSNGMCAGNTPEEALVQGLSEVFERHVNYKIIKEKMRLPDVPESYLAQYASLYKSIKEVERDGRYTVLVKDGSLDKGYPVVVLVIIDKARQSYGVRVGAHPEFEIALERCLSEAFQGRKLDTFTSLSALRFDNAGIELEDNFMNIAKIGMGQYPVELFEECTDREFAPFADVDGKSNAEVLGQLLELLVSQGYDVLIRDVSYLGFPAFHVIVPGFSEVHDVSLKVVREARSGLVSRKAVRDLQHAPENELLEMARYLKLKQYALLENSISALVGVELKEKYYGGAFFEHYFLIGASLYKLGILDEAAVVLGLAAQGMAATADRYYFRGIADYAAAAAAGKSKAEVEGVLKLFYPQSVFDKVCKVMEDPQTIMEKLYPRFNCFNCSQCEAAQNCSYHVADRIRRALKEKQVEAKMMDLGKLI